MTLCTVRVRESLVVIIVIFRRRYHTAVTIFCDFYLYIQRIIRIINNTFHRSCLFDLILIFLSDICLRIVDISKPKRLALSSHLRRLDDIALAFRHRCSIFSGQPKCPFVARLEITADKFLRHTQIQRSVCGICICKRQRRSLAAVNNIKCSISFVRYRYRKALACCILYTRDLPAFGYRIRIRLTDIVQIIVYVSKFYRCCRSLRRLNRDTCFLRQRRIRILTAYRECPFITCFERSSANSLRERKICMTLCTRRICNFDFSCCLCCQRILMNLCTP